MNSYTFQTTREIREAIYAALCHVKGDRWHRTLSNLKDITRQASPEVALSDIQVSAILSGLQAAIDAQSTDMGDWSRARDYAKARDFLISETRKQFRVVQK